MTPEEAYEEVRRLIREAEETGALCLYLDRGNYAAKEYDGLETLNRLPPELERLTSLQTLSIINFVQLSGNLSPVAELKSLRTLKLSGCEQLGGDLFPLGGLTCLQTLNLSDCYQLSGNLSPLAHLTSLRTIDLTGCTRLSCDLSPLSSLISIQRLDLSMCDPFDLYPLVGLTSLQTLILIGCKQLSDLSPLAGLTSLQTLHLGGCGKLSDLFPLAGLTSLQTLHLDNCEQLRRFAPLEPLLLALEELTLFGCRFEDLPPEVCGGRILENVLDKVRAHYDDIKSGQRLDAEVKLLFLGNGGVGKTQLCRRLGGLEFDLNVSTTHGIELGEIALWMDGFQEPVRLNLWDFGGQDIYHGSHALFLHGQVVFLLLWTPELEYQTAYQEHALSLRHRPLSYWVDYLRAFAGTDASVLVVQSQCDTRDKRVLHPPAQLDDFPFHRSIEVSARTGLNLGALKEHIKEAVRDRFNRRPPPPIGLGRMAVRDRLRQMLEEDQERKPTERQHRLLERAEFDHLCDEVGSVNDKEALLDFLHYNGAVFYRPGLFNDRIVLDQNWALEAIYAIFDRKKILPLLRGYGRFSRADLEPLIWSGYTLEEQYVFLGMMESCGICFRVRELPNDEWEYIAPELLPKWSDVQEQLLGRLRDDPPDAEATAKYAFLHEGILRGYLSKLGGHAKEAAIYWKYGCWFFEQTTRSQVLIESRWDDVESEAGAGVTRFRAWGERADDLVEQLLATLQTLPVGRPPEIKHIRNATVIIKAGLSPKGLAAFGSLDNLEISVRPEFPTEGKPSVFVSYAWGDKSSQEARQRTEVVDRLCETLGQDGWNIIRDKTDMRPGGLISGFMKRIGLADHVIVVFSDKYLRSPYCMTELHYLYQRSLGEKEDFLSRVIPLRLDDARFGTPEERVEYAKHWEARYLKLKSDLDHLSVEDFRLYKSMQKWHLDIGDMLAYVNDVLVPQGFDEIVKDDFTALRQMLTKRRMG